MNTRRWLQWAMGVAVCCATSGAFAAGPPIDTSPNRAKTPLNPGLKQLGTLKPRSANEIAGYLIVLWDNTGTPGDSLATRPAQVEVKGMAFKEPVWVDLVSGLIYEIPADRVQRLDTVTSFKDIPFYDAPVLLVERNLVIK